MAGKNHPADPKGLLAEAYRMDIGVEDCRTIFFDWAIGHPGQTTRSEIQSLLEAYGPEKPDHPMTQVLEEGLRGATGRPARRGGAKGRRR